MGLALIAENDIDDEPRDEIRVESRTFAPAPRAPFKINFPTDEVLASLTAIAGILGVRAAMFLSLAGAFSVAVIALQDPSAGRLVAMGLFNLTVLGPVMALCAFRRI